MRKLAPSAKQFAAITVSLCSTYLLLFGLAACGGGASPAPVTFTTTPTTPVAETPSANLPAVEVSAIEVKDPGSTLPEAWHKGAFMEIYVRGYKDSDGDGIGDLRGVVQSLDYLKELGIKGIWLMPITRSEDGDHGYAVTDYRNIETAYGNLADFDELIKQAHARGMGVILDYVMNHSGAKHPLFINSADTTTNAYRAWYMWRDVTPSGWNIFGSNPWYSTKNGAYFAAFYSGMPDFNLLNPSVLAFHQNNLRFWLNRGADGFRFDAVGNLVENGSGAWESQPESIALMGKIRLTMEAYKQRYIVCEAPGNPLAFAANDSCGHAFAFNHNHDIVNAAKGQSGAVQAVADYFKTATAEMATMLSNHDEFAGARMWDRVDGNLAQYRLAAATYLLQPGTPFIYYGEEIGLAGATNLSGDHKLRTPMSWNGNTSNAGFTTGTPFRALAGNVATQNLAAQLNDPNSLYHFYKAMLALRNSRSSLSAGNYSNVAANSNVLSFHRQSGTEKSLVVINYGTSESTVSLLNLPSKANLNSLFPDTSVVLTADTSGKAQIKLAAQSVMVLNVQ